MLILSIKQTRKRSSYLQLELLSLLWCFKLRNQVVAQIGIELLEKIDNENYESRRNFITRRCIRETPHKVVSRKKTRCHITINARIHNTILNAP